MQSNSDQSFVINAVESSNFMKSMIEGKLAYIDNTIALRTLSSSICNCNPKVQIYIAKDLFRDVMISFAFRKGFNESFQKTFNAL